MQGEKKDTKSSLASNNMSSPPSTDILSCSRISPSVSNSDSQDISLQSQLRYLPVLVPDSRSGLAPETPSSMLASTKSLPQVSDYANRRDFLNALLDEAITICNEGLEESDSDYPWSWNR